MGKVYNAEMLDSEYVNKMNDYKEYIDNHRKNVIEAFQDVFLKRYNDPYDFPSDIGFTTEEFKQAIKDVTPEVLMHDMSKYSDEEFYPYLDYFIKGYFSDSIPDDQKDPVIEAKYQEAWRHHYLYNAHHPKFWYYSEADENGNYTHHYDTKSDVAAPMLLKDIIHMISDWEGMSRKFGGSTLDWYNNKADEEKSDLNPETKIIVDKMLNTIFPR